MNKSNVVAITEEVKNLSSVDQSDTLGAGDISNVATVLEKIVSVNHNATEVGLINNSWFVHEYCRLY